MVTVVRGPVHGWIAFGPLDLFGCLATLIELVGAPIVVPEHQNLELAILPEINSNPTNIFFEMVRN